MALIECPECGKEISNKAKSCPNCGFPIEKTSKDITTDQMIVTGTPGERLANNEQSKRNKSSVKVVVFIVVIIAAIGICLCGIYYVKVFKPKTTYNKAVEMLNNGEYEDANKLLDTIPAYKDVDILQTQAYYETRVFQCIRSLKKSLKNPESLQVYQVKFYSKEFSDDVDVNEIMRDSLSKFISEHGDKPVVLMSYAAENSFGGNTKGYCMFIYLHEKYQLLGVCNTLDMDEVDEDQKSICNIINGIKKYLKSTGGVNISRISRILQEGDYESIKIIK